MAFEDEFHFSACFTCQQCCVDIPTFILGFHTLSYLVEQGSKNENFLGSIPSLIVYKVETSVLEAAAKAWHHWFGFNLFNSISVPDENGYEFVAISKSRGKCPFLSTSGCSLLKYKPFYCKMYPVLYFPREFMLASDCPLALESADTNLFDKGAFLIQNFANFCENHRFQYKSLVTQLQNQYDWPIHHFKSK
ncbi:MAG: hypothetical protein E4G98_04185 [Promethearchaeota archaeon]|nr:MAG: hypothetical protein E4G98_04185 [Candidatus Lokiarchaeota archaeon]